MIGREFSFGALSGLIDDLSEDDLLDVLEEALAARVIEELVDAVDSYQFTHALIQEVCAQELSATRRVRLHARIAQVLEELYGTGAEAHAAELAQHYAEAEAALGPDKLVHYSRIAGDRALVAHAYEEATAQFARALAAKEGQPTDTETANLLFGLARAEFAGREQPDPREALGHLRRAFDYYTTVGDAQRAVAVAAYPIPPMYGQTGVSELMAEALGLARADSPEEGRLLSTLGWFLGINDADYERSREAFDRSLAIAQRLGEQALETRALVGAAAVDYFHLKWRSCAEDSARALELALAAGDERTEMIARGWAARVSAVTGDLAGGRAHAAAALDLAEKLGERYWLATAHIHKEWLAVLAGDAQAARASSEAGLALQPEDARNLGSRALLEYQLGEFTYGEPTSTGSSTQQTAPILQERERFWPRLSQRSAASAERPPAEAPRWTPQRTCSPPHRSPRSSSCTRESDWHSSRFSATTPNRRGRRTRPSSRSETPLSPSPASQPTGFWACSRLTLGELDLALRHFESARLFCDRAGYRPEHAWTASAYAEVLLERGRPADREKATTLQRRGTHHRSRTRNEAPHGTRARPTTTSKRVENRPTLHVMTSFAGASGSRSRSAWLAPSAGSPSSSRPSCLSTVAWSQ